MKPVTKKATSHPSTSFQCCCGNVYCCFGSIVLL